MEWSGRPDSNRGPPVPKTGALTRLRYAPTTRCEIHDARRLGKRATAKLLRIFILLFARARKCPFVSGPTGESALSPPPLLQDLMSHTSPPRLAFFLPDLDRQAGRSALVDVANHAVDHCWAVDVMAPMGGGVLRGTLDLRIGQIDLNRRHVATSLGTLARALAERRPHLLIAADEWPGVIAACSLRLARQPIPLWVMTESCDGDASALTGEQIRYRRWLSRLNAHLVDRNPAALIFAIADQRATLRQG